MMGAGPTPLSHEASSLVQHFRVPHPFQRRARRPVLHGPRSGWGCRQRLRADFGLRESRAVAPAGLRGRQQDELPRPDLRRDEGMLASLDPHSQFMDPNDFKDMQDDTRSRFNGLGIEVAVKGGLLTVITPMEDTP